MIEEIDFCVDHGGCSIYAECSNSETEVRVSERKRYVFRIVLILNKRYFSMKISIKLFARVETDLRGMGNFQVPVVKILTNALLVHHCVVQG